MADAPPELVAADAAAAASAVAPNSLGGWSLLQTAFNRELPRQLQAAAGVLQQIDRELRA